MPSPRIGTGGLSSTYFRLCQRKFSSGYVSASGRTVVAEQRLRRLVSLLLPWSLPSVLLGELFFPCGFWVCLLPLVSWVAPYGGLLISGGGHVIFSSRGVH